jgi:GNAT superfamily N-acetyltransferase
MAVDENYHGKGIGKLMLLHGIANAKKIKSKN